MGVDPINSVTSSATCSARAATSRVKRVIGQQASVAAGFSIGRGPFWRGGRAGPFITGVIASLGADDQLVVAFGLRLDMNRAETALAHRLGGVITNRVLLTNILRYLSGNLILLGKILGEKGDTPSLISQHFQRPLGTAGLAAAAGVVVEQSYRIDDRPLQILNATNRFLQAGAGSIGFPVGDDQENLLGALGILGEVIGRRHDGVVKRRPPLGIDVR